MYCRITDFTLARRSTASILGFKSDNSSNGIDARASSLSGVSLTNFKAFCLLRQSRQSPLLSYSLLQQLNVL